MQSKCIPVHESQLLFYVCINHELQIEENRAISQIHNNNKNEEKMNKLKDIEAARLIFKNKNSAHIQIKSNVHIHIHINS